MNTPAYAPSLQRGWSRQSLLCVGENVGDVDGDCVGSNDGDVDGPWVGITVGAADGDDEGEAVGAGVSHVRFPRQTPLVQSRSSKHFLPGKHG